MKAVLFLGLAFLSTAALADDVATLVTEAQRAYIKGERAQAKEKFDLVLKLDPNNRLALQYSRRIKAEELKESAARGPANATESVLKTVILPKVQFTDASLGDVLEFIRQKGNQVAEGRAAINFVIKLDEAAKNRKVTLSLQNVPFTEVVKYIGQLADVEFVYEPFAILVRQKAPSVQPVATETPSTGVKIEGL